MAESRKAAKNKQPKESAPGANEQELAFVYEGKPEAKEDSAPKAKKPRKPRAPKAPSMSAPKPAEETPELPVGIKPKVYRWQKNSVSINTAIAPLETEERTPSFQAISLQEERKARRGFASALEEETEDAASQARDWWASLGAHSMAVGFLCVVLAVGAYVVFAAISPMDSSTSAQKVTPPAVATPAPYVPAVQLPPQATPAPTAQPVVSPAQVVPTPKPSPVATAPAAPKPVFAPPPAPKAAPKQAAAAKPAPKTPQQIGREELLYILNH